MEDFTFSPSAEPGKRFGAGDHLIRCLCEFDRVYLGTQQAVVVRADQGSEPLVQPLRSLTAKAGA